MKYSSRSLFVVILLTINLSCVVADPWDRGSYGGSGEDEQLRTQAARTCRDYAAAQRLDVQRVLSSRPMGAGNDYEVHLRVRRGGRSDDVICYTDVRTRSTRIAESISLGGTGQDEDLRRHAAATCRDYAEGQRLDVQRVLSSRSLGSGNDYEVHLSVVRRGRTENIVCFTDVKTGSTRIQN